MALTHRENYLRNARFQRPEYIPCTVSISGASWKELRGDLEDVLVRHPILFPGFKKGQRDFDATSGRSATGELVDCWGCRWENAIEGIIGVVIGHPLASWDAFKTYQPPDPNKFEHMGPCDWEKVIAGIRDRKSKGGLASGPMGHGFLYMRLTYLRGFENCMIDMASDEPNLLRLISMVKDFNLALVKRYLAAGVDVLEFGEDLGTQTASVLGPRLFDKWLAPAYRELMGPCRAAGALVALHSDGYIMDIAENLMGCGVDIINPQDLCNGLDNIERVFKGRVCIRLDIDRQSVVPFGKPKEIGNLIEEEVRRLGSPEGGLEMIIGIYPPTPPENVDAVITAMEKFRTYWWDGRSA